MGQNKHEMTVVMDANYWIDFEKFEDQCEEFHETKNNIGYSVTFTRANFVDMVNTEQQDLLSPMIAETADAYMAIDTYNTGEYYRDKDPVVLAHPNDRETIGQRTAELTDGERLQYLFRNIDQEPEAEAARLAQQIKEVYDEHGRSYAELWAFGTHVSETVKGGCTSIFRT